MPLVLPSSSGLALLKVMACYACSAGRQAKLFLNIVVQDVIEVFMDYRLKNNLSQYYRGKTKNPTYFSKTRESVQNAHSRLPSSLQRTDLALRLSPASRLLAQPAWPLNYCSQLQDCSMV